MDAIGTQLAFVTPANATRWQRRLVFSPVARIVSFVVTMIAAGFLLGSLLHLLGWTAKDADPALRALAMLLEQVLPALIAYLALVRGVERRPVAELSLRRLPAQGGLGLLIGIALMSITVAALWLLGVSAPHAQQNLVAQGKALYEDGCSSCHGLDARGITGRAPSLRGVGTRGRLLHDASVADTAALLDHEREGGHRFARDLAAEDRAALLGFLTAL